MASITNNFVNHPLVFYKGTNQTVKQFKTISEFYGNISGLLAPAFFRGIVHFKGCKQLQLFGFMRYGKKLFQVRPTESLLKDYQYSKNAHLFIPVVTSLKEYKIFTSESKAIQQLKARRSKRETSQERKYCCKFFV